MSVTRKDAMLGTMQLRERGWTKSLITRFLGEPDKVVSNSHHRSGPKIKLWSLERVEQAEKLATFQAQREKAAKRSAAAAAAASSRRTQLLESITKMVVKVEPLESSTRLERAIEHYNDAQLFTDYSRRADKDSDPEFLQRIQVNFIRHRLTSYDEELDKVAGQLGAPDARNAIRDKIYDAIAEAYPELEEECERQRDSRESS